MNANRDVGVAWRAIPGMHGAARGIERGAGPDHRNPGGHRHRRCDGEAGGRGAGHREQPRAPGRADHGDGRPRPLHLHAPAAWTLQARGPDRGLPARRAWRPRLRVDYTLRANLAMAPETVQAEEQVIRSRIAPAVNVGNAERRGGDHPGVPGDHSDHEGLRGNRDHHPDRGPGPGRDQPGRSHVAREQLHARRPSRRRPERQLPGLEPPHQLHRPDRREDRRVPARIRLLVRRDRERRDQVRVERVPRVDLGQPHAGSLHAPERGDRKERRGGGLVRLPLQGFLPERLWTGGGRSHREGPALVLRRPRRAAQLRRAHRLLPEPRGESHRSEPRRARRKRRRSPWRQSPEPSSCMARA